MFAKEETANPLNGHSFASAPLFYCCVYIKVTLAYIRGGVLLCHNMYLDSCLLLLVYLYKLIVPLTLLWLKNVNKCKLSKIPKNLIGQGLNDFMLEALKLSL